MKTIFLSLAITLSVVFPAMSESWQHIATSEDGKTVLSLDAESLTKVDGLYRYKTMILDQSENRGMIGYSEMSCKTRSERLISYDSYDNSGQIIESRQAADSTFKPIMVDSLTSVLWQTICK
ncbi:surface-adhesin E family protein [Nostoc sp.]|uniref:surface-adhesin E family protein n=1 Tax=Nostoc sp. TaxID=1180 RepID=UPI002FF4EE07